jgi:pseudouridine-5'-phosphate glycosidase
LYFCENDIVSNSSNPAQKATSIGGVCSNIALIKNNAKIAAMIAEALQGIK